MEIKEIHKENNLYPMMLKKIKNPPEKLYVLGNVNLLNEECLSIVGSRNCTEYGAKMARKFAMELAREWCCDSKWNGKWNR